MPEAKFKFRYTLMCLVVLFLTLFLIDHFLPDGPGPGMALFLFFAIFLIFLAISLIISIVKWVKTRKFAPLSKPGAPLIAVASMLALAFAGLTPDRLAFEIYRPFYVTQILRFPAVDNNNTREYIWAYRELWNGEQVKETIIYDRKSKFVDSEVYDPQIGKIYTSYQDLNFGFYKKMVTTIYQPFAPPPSFETLRSSG